jgi:hypothetical protein
MSEAISEFELYKVVFKKKIIDSFKDIELPPEWPPRDVIKFIKRKIEETE